MDKYESLIKKKARHKAQQKRKVANSSATLSRQLQHLKNKPLKRTKLKININLKKK